MDETTQTHQKKYAKYVLYILTGVYVFNFIDRQILVVIQELIKKDLNLSDGQLGLLTGFAFAIFYVTLGLPIARLADKTNRKNVISASLVLWSGMTAISGLVVNYWQLLLARIGVGIGEAGGSPPAHSIISDYFPPEKRATALSIYSSGIYIGVMVGFLGGGIIAQKFGWRVTLLAMGIPGILYAFLVYFFVKEPVRGMGEKIKVTPNNQSFGENLRKLLTPTFILVALGSGAHAFLTYSLLSWAPPLLARIHEWNTLQIGLTLAITNGIGGIAGNIVGGRLTDKLGRKNKSWYVQVPMIAGVLTLFPVAAIIFGGGTYWLVIMILLAVFLTSVYLGPILGVLLSLVRPNMRSFTSAIYFFILNTIGLGLGPTVVGFISDYLAPSYGNESIRYALTIVFLMEVISIFLFYAAAKRYPKALAKFEASITQE
ncbi:MAG TPA: MFS transporter [Microscillaceae bacterium]|nr:MFS transporter [Microscillaceae bacterium]